MKRLTNKTAFVTGAANGIGAAIATLFARHGANVVLADINKDAGLEVLKSIKQDGGNAEFVRLDVTSWDNWLTAVESTLASFGQINTLVNNAGMYHPSNLASETLEGWEKMLSVNQSSVFQGMKAV